MTEGGFFLSDVYGAAKENKSESFLFLRPFMHSARTRTDGTVEVEVLNGGSKVFDVSEMDVDEFADRVYEWLREQ